MDSGKAMHDGHKVLLCTLISKHPPHDRTLRGVVLKVGQGSEAIRGPCSHKPCRVSFDSIGFF